MNRPWRPTETTVAAFAALAAAYPSWRPAPETMQAWEWMLSDCEPAALLKAVLEHCRSAKWPPTVAELREAVRAAQPATQPSAEEAWAEVVTHAKAAPHHVWGSDPAPEYLAGPAWSCDQVRVAASVLQRKGGGWPVLPEDARTADRARFMAAYESKGQVERKAAERAGVERLLTGPRPLFALLPGRGA